MTYDNSMQNGEGLRRLEAENARLRDEVRHDWLTRLFNRGAVEQLVNEGLSHGPGAMIVIDIDRFKQINDRWGHLIGDRVLRQLSALMRRMFFQSDVIGRVGGDEFIIFIHGECSESFLTERITQLKRRLASETWADSSSINLRIAAGCAVSKPGDNYDSLFSRADQVLLSAKRSHTENDGQKHLLRSIEADMRRISAELREEERAQGAYCRDYAHFESIYRYVERTLRRYNQHACVILLTLTDKNGNLPEYPALDIWMSQLHEAIKNALRISDVFTQYSSCQFLIMNTGAEQQYTELIAERVRSRFYECCPESSETLLLHSSFPMEPKG